MGRGAEIGSIYIYIYICVFIFFFWAILNGTTRVGRERDRGSLSVVKLAIQYPLVLFEVLY